MAGIIVVAGIVFNACQEVLITKRGHDKEGAGLWEFPGGKVEIGERHQTALYRELNEELGIEIETPSHYLTLQGYLSHERPLTLEFYKVCHFKGTPRCLETQLDLKWVSLAALKDYDFPPLNEELIKHLRGK